MKKRLTLFSLLLFFTVTAMAKTLVDGIYYNLNESDNTAEVAASVNYRGDIVIPASISVNGVDYSVTSIGSSAFRGCDGLTSIEIPNSVTYIGSSAFYKCSGLTSIKIPNSVTSIEGYAFYYCSSLTSIEIPNSVTSIGEYAFYCCRSLTSIEIPNSVTEIGWSAFRGCSGLTSIEIPNSVTEIESYAFSGCSGLTSIEIPNSVTSIGDDAFTYCYRLTSIEIPNSVTWIGYSVFYGCSGLTSITMQRATPPTVGRDLFNYCSLKTIYVPVGASEAYNYYEPWNKYYIVEQVEVDGLYYNLNVENKTVVQVAAAPNYTKYSGDIVVPASISVYGVDYSVTSIDYYAFAGCSGLTSIEIPNSVTAIGGSAFEGCSSLTSIEIPNSVTDILEYAFRSCDGLTSITMQRATPPIVRSYLFDECSKLETIYVPVGASEAYNKYPWNKYKIVEREVTGIEEVTQEEWPADVYDLNGRMVKAQAESLDELPKGVYIVNGKKFVK